MLGRGDLGGVKHVSSDRISDDVIVCLSPEHVTPVENGGIESHSLEGVLVGSRAGAGFHLA